MNQRDDLDRVMGAWIDEPYAAPTARILARVLERTQRTPQRRAWASLERWLPVSILTRPAPAQPLRAALLLVLALLVAALVVGGAVVGSRLLPAPVHRAVLPGIPQGDEAVFALKPDDRRDIFIVRADGTELRPLTDGHEVTSAPAWSPDGTRLAYRSGQTGVAVLDVTTGEVTVIGRCEAPASECDWAMAWSPDGTSVIFAASVGGSYDLWIAPADGSIPAVRLLAAGMNSIGAAWSPDGSRLAYLASEPEGSVGLYVADVTAGEALAGGIRGSLLRPDLGPDVGTVGFGGSPQWSPDGAELAVTAVPSGFALVEAEGIHIVAADGSGERLLTERAGNPMWSPDGRRIAFHRTVDPAEYVHDRPCTVRTWVIDADGRNERRLDELGDGCAGPPLWSPDGTRLASELIVQLPGDPAPVETSDSSVGVPFHLGFVMVDGGSPPVFLLDAYGSWQPVAAPLPPAPASPAAS